MARRLMSPIQCQIPQWNATCTLPGNKVREWPRGKRPVLRDSRRRQRPSLPYPRLPRVEWFSSPRAGYRELPRPLSAAGSGGKTALFRRLNGHRSTYPACLNRRMGAWLRMTILPGAFPGEGERGHVGEIEGVRMCMRVFSCEG